MEKSKTYTHTFVAKDKTTQTITATRDDMESWLIAHNKQKLLCDDTDQLFQNYKHAYTLDYNRNHPKQKGTHGGLRENAGRKPKSPYGTIRVGLRMPADIYQYITNHETLSLPDFILKAVREKIEREDRPALLRNIQSKLSEGDGN